MSPPQGRGLIGKDANPLWDPLVVCLQPLQISRITMAAKILDSSRRYPATWRNREAAHAALPADEDIMHACGYAGLVKISTASSSCRAIPSASGSPVCAFASASFADRTHLRLWVFQLTESEARSKVELGHHLRRATARSYAHLRLPRARHREDASRLIAARDGWIERSERDMERGHRHLWH